MRQARGAAGRRGARNSCGYRVPAALRLSHLSSELRRQAQLNLTRSCATMPCSSIPLPGLSSLSLCLPAYIQPASNSCTAPTHRTSLVNLLECQVHEVVARVEGSVEGLAVLELDELGAAGGIHQLEATPHPRSQYTHHRSASRSVEQRKWDHPEVAKLEECVEWKPRWSGCQCDDHHRTRAEAF